MTRGPRLRPGELRQMVTDHLAQHPKIDFTPTELGNKLRRSSGAIANALLTLCEQGEAVQTNTTPRRYRATHTGRAARRRARN